MRHQYRTVVPTKPWSVGGHDQTDLFLCWNRRSSLFDSSFCFYFCFCRIQSIWSEIFSTVYSREREDCSSVFLLNRRLTVHCQSKKANKIWIIPFGNEFHGYSMQINLFGSIAESMWAASSTTQVDFVQLFGRASSQMDSVRWGFSRVTSWRELRLSFR